VDSLLPALMNAEVKIMAVYCPQNSNFKKLFHYLTAFRSDTEYCPRDQGLASTKSQFLTQPSDTVVSDIKFQLRAKASPRHVPAKIIAAPELPRTKSNKLVELAVTEVINNREVKNLEALANPESLNWFKNLFELQT